MRFGAEGDNQMERENGGGKRESVRAREKRHRKRAEHCGL